MQSVQFYMTEISGDCILTASTNKRALKIGDPGVDIGTEDIITYNKSISKQYYLRVQAY